MPFCFGWRSIPFWCCFDGFVSGVYASLSLPCPVRPAGSRDRACLPLDGRCRCSSACGAGYRAWRPGDLSWSPVHCALRQVRSSRSSSESFEVVQAGFLPPTAGRSIIGGTSACSGLLLRVTALLSGLRAGDCGLPLLRMGSRTGMGGRLSSPPSGEAGCGNSCTLDALCIGRNFFPVTPGLF